MPTSLPYRPLPSTLLVTHARLARPLPYTWANMPHIRTDPTPFRVVAGSKPRASPSSNFTILHFLPRTIAYTAEQVHQQASGRSHPHNGVGIRIRSSTFLGRSRMLQSSYTRRRLADRIRILRSDRYGLGEGRLGDSDRSPPRDIGIPAYDQSCSGAALPRRRPEGDSIAVRKLSGRSQGGSYAIKLTIL